MSNEIQHMVVEAVRMERDRQDMLWGPDHDDEHTTPDWWRFIDQRVPREHVDEPEEGIAIVIESEEVTQNKLVEVAALAIAALEAMARHQIRRALRSEIDTDPQGR